MQKAVLREMGLAYTPCNLMHRGKAVELQMHGNPSSSAHSHCKANNSVLNVRNIGFSASNQSSNLFSLLSSLLQSLVPDVSYSLPWVRPLLPSPIGNTSEPCCPPPISHKGPLIHPLSPAVFPKADSPWVPTPAAQCTLTGR